MEVVVGNGKMMRAKRFNLTRCSKTKSFGKNHAIHRNVRIKKTNFLRSSVKHKNNRNLQEHGAISNDKEMKRSSLSKNSSDTTTVSKNNRNLSLDVSNFLNNNDSNYSCLRDEVCFGEFTREVHNAICGRLGDTLHIPEDSVQALFNDLKLFPSKSQVAEMLQCARQCSRRNGAPDHLTFGEFCFLVREMQTQNPKPQRKTSSLKINNKCTNNKCDVFLGGSCNPTTWRADTAIPELQKRGITFYNPQVSFWAPELVAQEYDAKQAASILLFVIDSQTRSTVGMIEVAYLVASGRCVVVVAQPYERGQSIMGEKITDREFRDLVDGQNTLLNLVRSKGVKIHTNLSTALQCTANILRNSSTNGTSAEEQITYKLRKLREVYDSYGGELDLYDVKEAFEKLTNRSLDINKLYNYKNRQNGYSTINFERFCAFMAEFSTSDGCDMCTTDVWAKQPFQRQCSGNNNNNAFNFTNNSRIDRIMEPLKLSPDIDDDDDDPVQTQTDIFLGGSMCSTRRWREQIAIPLVKKHGLIYYNPAVRENGKNNGFGHEVNGFCHEENNGNNGGSLDVLEWKRALDRSRVLLMVITNDTRSMTSIILAAFYMGLGKDVVLCVQNLPIEGCVIGNETLTKNAVKDYNRARVYLTDLANRKQVPVFENITEAVECAIERCKSR